MAVVMIVEDTDSTRKLMARLMVLAGHRPVCAESGPAALRKLEESQPDLMLLDLSMPGMDGLTMLELMRANPQWQSLPVIMVSAVSDSGTVERAKRLGAKDYPVKARFSVEDLLGRVEQYAPAAKLC